MKWMPRVLPIAALAVGIISCTFFDYSSVTTNRYALVYGVTTYVPSLASNAYNDPNLSYPHLDAKAVAEMFAAKGYKVQSRWVDDQGYVYVNGVRGANVGADSSQAPTKSNLEADLASYKSLMGSNDEFVFYFSGHGMQDTTTSLEYFVPYGAILSEPGGSGTETYTYYCGDTALSVSDPEMGLLLSQNIPTSRKVVILDSCNSGGFIGKSLDVDTSPQSTSPYPAPAVTIGTINQAIANYANYPSGSGAISPYNASVLSASGADESCYDDGDHLHGAMTYYFLQTAAQADFNGDGSVTVREAFSFVKAAIENNWNKAYPDSAFTPHISGGPVDFVLL